MDKINIDDDDLEKFRLEILRCANCDVTILITNFSLML